MTGSGNYTPLTITYAGVNCAQLTHQMINGLIACGESPSEYNTWTHPMGLSNWGSMSVIVNQSDYENIKSGAGSASPLVMQCVDSDSSVAFNVTFPSVYAVDSYPIHPNKSIYRVVLADKRWLAQYAVMNGQFNYPVMNQGTPTYIASTTDSGAAYTLQQIVSKITASISNPTVSLTLPSAVSSDTPEALAFNYEPSARLLDAILYSYGLIVLYDPKADQFSVDFIGNQGSQLDTWRTASNTYAWNQGNGDQLAPSAPSQVSVAYPILPPVAVGANPYYQSLNSTGAPSQTVSGAQPMAGTSFAWGSGNTTPNSPSVMSQGYYYRAIGLRYDRVYGISVPPMVGAIERIVWKLALNQIMTTVEYTRSPSPGNRPQWATINPYGACSYYNLLSRVDAAGRLQMFALDQAFPAQITGSSQISANIWSYTFEEVGPTGSNTGAWQAITGGRTGTAVNSVENGNTSTGILSAGWNSANFCTNQTLQPIRTGAVVPMFTTMTCGTSPTVQYYFALGNDIAGAC